MDSLVRNVKCTTCGTEFISKCKEGKGSGLCIECERKQFYATLKLCSEDQDKFLERAEHILNNVLEKCCICMQTMIGVIKLCITGHSLCGECADKVDRCPICRCAMTENRNYALEDLAREIYENLEENKDENKVEEPVLISCKFQTWGCTKHEVKEIIEAHHDGCEFRPTVCLCCDKDETSVDVLDHWNEMSLRYPIRNGGTIGRPSPFHFIRAYGQLFVYSMHENERVHYFSVHHITLEKKTHYYFKIDLINRESKVKHVLKGICITSTIRDLQNKQYLQKAGVNTQLSNREIIMMFRIDNRLLVHKHKIIIYSKSQEM